jgi:hypothetical protein
VKTDPDHVLRAFMPDGVLLRMPAKQGKRQVLLELVAQRFEPGVRYSEPEVDDVLRAVTDGGEADHVSLRRYLVDSGLLAREAGVYWRSGGWVADT